MNGIEQRAALVAFPPKMSTTSTDWPEPLDLEALGEREPQPPQFVIPDWGPAGYAWLFASHGGVGKSGIKLHMAVCMALERPFFGLDVKQRRVMYLSCEDREDVLHWRLSRICQYERINIASLRGQLEVVDLVGHDCVLWERAPYGGPPLTSAYGRLQERVQRHGTEVLVVDGISDTFAGSGGSKTDVKRYVNSLLALTPPDRGAVALLGHIDKQSARNGAGTEGYDGTTGWHNSVRARWYLYPETERGDDGNARTGDLILELQKSNLGRIDRSMRFAWDAQAHLFVGREVTPATALDRAHRDNIEQRGIVEAMKACAAGNIAVPAATTGNRTAYHVLSAQPTFPDTLQGKPNVRRFWSHVERLRAMGTVNDESQRQKDGHNKVRLALSSERIGQSGNEQNHIDRAMPEPAFTGNRAMPVGGYRGARAGNTRRRNRIRNT